MDIKKEIEILMDKAKLTMTPEEIELYSKDLLEYRKGIEIFRKLDLEGVKPADFAFEVETDHLRSDDVVSNNPEGLVERASKSENGYIVLEED